MFKSQNGYLSDIFITITKHIEMYMVVKQEMLMLYMYHIGELTWERLV